VIGITTNETKAEANKGFSNYQFLQYAPIVLAESKSLRANGAHAIVLVAHLGDNCDYN
jgi:2',3'-cyclic-nucleotide 2'-phosphodiesterase (5'-nucleotidase family)